MVDWQEGEPPVLRRTVLSRPYPKEPWEAMFLEKLQGRLQAAVHQLKRDGLASGLWVALPETLKGYLP